jgi:hypothetical protein
VKARLSRSANRPAAWSDVPLRIQHIISPRSDVCFLDSAERAVQENAELPRAAEPMVDLLDSLSISNNGAHAGTAASPSPADDDPFGLSSLGGSQGGAAQAAQQLPLLSEAHGCEVRGRVVRGGGGRFVFRAALANRSGASISGFHVQFNRNAAGVGVHVGDTALAIGPLAPGEAGVTDKVLEVTADKLDPSQGRVLQTALKWTELTAANFVMLQVRTRSCSRGYLTITDSPALDQLI